MRLRSNNYAKSVFGSYRMSNIRNSNNDGGGGESVLLPTSPTAAAAIATTKAAKSAVATTSSTTTTTTGGKSSSSRRLVHLTGGNHGVAVGNVVGWLKQVSVCPTLLFNWPKIYCTRLSTFVCIWLLLYFSY